MSIMYHEMYFIIPRETWQPVDLLITSLRKAEKNFNERVLRSDLRQFQNLLAEYQSTICGIAGSNLKTVEQKTNVLHHLNSIHNFVC